MYSQNFEFWKSFYVCDGNAKYNCHNAKNNGYNMLVVVCYFLCAFFYGKSYLSVELVTASCGFLFHSANSSCPIFCWMGFLDYEFLSGSRFVSVLQ